MLPGCLLDEQMPVGRQLGSGQDGIFAVIAVARRYLPLFSLNIPSIFIDGSESAGFVHKKAEWVSKICLLH
jgi:hypothetical protein